MSVPPAERVLRLALQILDLSLDVDRNIDDSLFRDEGGEIIYIFDANIFEVFMRPFERRGHHASLHATDWRGEMPIPQDARDSLAAQTALLTSEFLLSGDLPGQRDGKMYLSEWHSWEFARRATFLADRQIQALVADPPIESVERLGGILARMFDENTIADQLDRIRKDDPVLAADMEDIRKNNLLSDERDWRAFISNRELLRLLATEDRLEPAEQLKRLVSARIRRRMRLLHAEFPVPSSSIPLIAEDAKLWFRRLQDECAERGIPVIDDRSGEDEPGRRRGALRDDAKSLAFARWAAVNRALPDRRLVFVTADNLMFDVYRDWHADLDPRTPEYTEPFFLRRLIQYAPIFNLADSRNALGEDVRRFFDRLQGIIQFTLLPINLANPVSSDRHGRADQRHSARIRMVEKTALRSLKDTSISEDIAYLPLTRAIEREGLDRYGARLSQLVDEWRRLERATLGVADDYVRARLSQKQLELFELTPDGLSRASITAYIEHLIDDLYEGSLALWLPWAREAVLNWKPDVKAGRPRPPIAFRLHLDETHNIDLGQAVEDRATGAVDTPLLDAIQWPSLQERPDALFALAACLALASENWSNADHFAEMALRDPPSARRGDAHGPRPDDERRFELRYLNALTKRFRIGVIGPARNADAITKIRRGARDAMALLTACWERHSQSDGGQLETLRLIRALSERAAVGLFHAAALIPAIRAAPVPGSHGKGRETGRDPGFGPNLAQEVKQEAEDALRQAEADLLECHQVAAGLTPVDELQFFERLRAQFFINTASATVLRNLLFPADPQPWQPFPESILKQLEAQIRGPLLAFVRGRSFLLQAEMLSFLLLRGDEQARAELMNLRGRPFNSSLNLDMAVYAAVIEQALIEPRTRAAAAATPTIR